MDRKSKTTHFAAGLAIAGLAFVMGSGASGQEIEEVVVLGSQIKGVDIAGALPVSAMTSEDILLTGATNGDELLRSIPQIGAVGFNESVTTGVNAARGDVNSINLRGLGTGNTLVLINGRRMVLHPGTQTENFIPVVTSNSNTIPVNALEGLEVLRDGAAALYGTDAVAGVINYKLDDDYEGSTLRIRYGTSQGTDLDEITISGAKGFEFNNGQTHLTLSGTYYDKTGFSASDRAYSANSDLRGLFEDDPLFAGDTSLDNRSGTFLGWGEVIYGQNVLIGDALDTSEDRFHVQPNSLSGCRIDLAGGLCLDDNGSDRDLRQNRNITRQLSPDSNRINLFAFLTQDLEDGRQWYSEFGYYKAEADRVREQAGLLSNGRFTVPADYYFNPFGPVTFDDGRANPNRIADADARGVPAEGIPFLLRNFTPYDTGFRQINVEDTSIRFVTGLRGTWNEWDWDTGFVYSEAETVDSTDNRISTTLFQQALMSDQPDAYNIFNGLDVNDTTSPFDPTPNARAAIGPFLINVTRASETSLTLADFKVSNPAIFSAPAGDVGIALGVEWREEDFTENRDDRSDGSIQFTDQITGELLNVSDIVGSSASPDASGSRRVASAYAEFAVPLARDLPAIQSMDLQLAARYEDFSDVGSVAKPKIALSWAFNDWLQFRSAYSKGFRAPNLTQLNLPFTTVVNTRTDPVTGDNGQIEERRSGNLDLQPEDSENFTYGLVITPTADLTITADAWKIEQDGVIGLLGATNALALDELLRASGSSNPNVIREAATDDSVGFPIVILDQFENLEVREVEGFDFSVKYDLDTSIGGFDFKLNGAYLSRFEQTPGPVQQQLIDAGANVTNAQSLIKQNGRPRWRSSASVRWKKDQWGAGVFARYVGDVEDTSTRADSDTAEPGKPLPVDSFSIVSASVNYTFEGTGFSEGARVTLGLRNLFDEEPPVADQQLGYFGSLHSNRGRYLYLSLRKNFD